MITLNEILARRRPLEPRAVEPSAHNCDQCWDREIIEFLTLADGQILRLRPDQRGTLEQWNYPDSRVSTCACDCALARNAARRLAKILNSGEVPERFHKFSFESWLQMPARDRVGKEEMFGFCRAYTESEVTKDSEKFGAVLSGPPGLGKTGLAFCILQERAKRGQVVLWTDWTDLVNKSRAAVGNPSSSMDKMIDACCEVPFLLLDDVGDMARRAEITDFVRDVLYSIVSRRHGRNRELIMTTNLDYRQFESQFGERIASRIFEMCYWVDATGRNLRKG